MPTTERPFVLIASGLEKTLQRFVQANKAGTVTVLQVQMFLRIAANPGITQTELYEALGSNDSVASRNIAILSDLGSRTTDGMGLIEMRRNPQDRRAWTLHLTRKGELLVKDIESDLGGAKRRS